MCVCVCIYICIYAYMKLYDYVVKVKERLIIGNANLLLSFLTTL